MIKGIIFDFDGVLIESAQIKTDAFRMLFSKWPEKVDEIVSYHINNMGVSRYVKFRYIYENIIRKPYSEEIGLDLGGGFSDLVLEKIKEAPLVKGTERFLEKAYKRYFLFIASGTPQEELDDIVFFKDIYKYFKGVFGTPPGKTEIVKNILTEYGFEKKQVVFVGDAGSDKKTADDTGIHFILRITKNNFEFANSTVYTIHDLSKLENRIVELENTYLEHSTVRFINNG